MVVNVYSSVTNFGDQSLTSESMKKKKNQAFLSITLPELDEQNLNISHYKAFGMKNLQYEMKIVTKKIMKSQ